LLAYEGVKNGRKRSRKRKQKWLALRRRRGPEDLEERNNVDEKDTYKKEREQEEKEEDKEERTRILYLLQ